MTKSNLKKLFGIKIKSIRKNLGLSQEAFAEKIGLERGSISKIETGQRFPSASNIDKISSTFQINYADLFNFNNSSNTPDINKSILIELLDVDIQTQKFILNFIKLYKLNHKK